MEEGGEHIDRFTTKSDSAAQIERRKGKRLLLLLHGWLELDDGREHAFGGGVEECVDGERGVGWGEEGRSGGGGGLFFDGGRRALDGGRVGIVGDWRLKRGWVRRRVDDFVDGSNEVFVGINCSISIGNELVEKR